MGNKIHFILKCGNNNAIAHEHVDLDYTSDLIRFYSVHTL